MVVPQCEHILDAGTQCGSPAVNGHKFCFFHVRLNQRPERRSDGSIFFVLRDLTCVESIQIAVSNVLHALNDGLIDSRKANSLYRGLSLALSTLRLKLAQKKHDEKLSSSETRANPFSRIFSLMPDNFTINTNVSQDPSTGIPACAEADATTSAEGPTDPAQSPVIVSEKKDLCISVPTTSTADHPLPSSPDPQIPLSNSRVKALKRITRQGPRHPLFHSSARRLEAHIVAKRAAETDTAKSVVTS